jgi:antitoxin MazE
MQVSKWGNSLAIRLPAAVVEVLGLKVGDDIEIDVASKQNFTVKRKASNREVLARLRKYRGVLPADFKFNRDDAYGADERRGGG